MKTGKRIISFVLAFLMLVSVWALLPNSFPKAAKKVKLSSKKLELYVGNVEKLKLIAAKGKVKWSSSNSEVAKVSKKGVITGIKKGKAIIKAVNNGKTYECKVRVKSAELSDKKLVLRVENGYALSLNGSLAEAEWNSSNEAVATVNENGFISPLAVGSAKITAKIQGEEYICDLSVVKAFSEEEFTYDTPDNEGFTNFIDMNRKKGSFWHNYYDKAGVSLNMNRGVAVGDSYSKFYEAYGYCAKWDEVKEYDSYSKYFTNSAYPRYKTTFEFWDSFTQNTYYKTFYFDGNRNLVLIVLYRY